MRRVSALLLALTLAAPLSVRCQTFQELYAFIGGLDGGVPEGALIQARDGNFYGTTSDGGTQNLGTVFKISPDGNLTTIASFTGSNGQHPYGALLEASDGNFYGTVLGPCYGAVFRMTPEGSLTYANCTDDDPTGDLVQATNGYIYGAAQWGGLQQEGTLFKFPLTSPWPMYDVFTFYGGNAPQYGYYPSGGLIQGRDGNLYGVTSEGRNQILRHDVPDYTGGCPDDVGIL